jgi:hypothetical protein
MAEAFKICATRGCPRITAARYCTEHARANDKARGTKAQRGYGRGYQSERKVWVRMVAEGVVSCWRCHAPIPPGGDFHLGHDDNDRSIIRGPECPPCNLSAAGKSAHH